MSDIDKKLDDARNSAGKYGRLYGAKETADDYLKITYAGLYEGTTGTVAERDAWVKTQEAYRAAVQRKQNAYADFKVAETEMKITFTEAEIWRTECANNRFMDRAHR